MTFRSMEFAQKWLLFAYFVAVKVKVNLINILPPFFWTGNLPREKL